MATDFKKRRIDYLNNWPNVEPFEIEKVYCDLVKKIKTEEGTVFVPFPLKENLDVSFNKTVSFMIDAVEQLEKYPNFSYEFIFKAYDCYMDLYHPGVHQITDKNKKLCDNEWKNIFNVHPGLLGAFERLISLMPVRACQYLYLRLAEKSVENKAYQRVTTDISGGVSANSRKRKDLVDAIEVKYGVDYNRYPDTIRKASLLYRYILKNSNVSIDAQTYDIAIEDKLHILVSGFLYTLRNDIMHGSSISITKSSKTTLSTYAIDYFAFLLLYYLLIILIVNKNPQNYSVDVYDRMANNIDRNIHLYMQLFDREVER